MPAPRTPASRKLRIHARYTRAHRARLAAHRAADRLWQQLMAPRGWRKVTFPARKPPP